MSSGNVKVRLKVGANEVEIEGSTSDIEKAISLIPEMIQALPEEMVEQSMQIPMSQRIPESSRLEKYMPPSSITKPSQPSNLPEIHIDRGNSLSDIIIKLFMDPWGRKPRKLGEVREALQSYGQVYPKQSVAVALLRLAQSGRLRRFKGEGGEYVYTASTTLTAEDTGRVAPVQP
ncbi:MAG: hypothetical protein ACE5KU_01775 [Nitrososphaerales archaeon]